MADELQVRHQQSPLLLNKQTNKAWMKEWSSLYLSTAIMQPTSEILQAKHAWWENSENVMNLQLKVILVNEIQYFPQGQNLGVTITLSPNFVGSFCYFYRSFSNSR